MTPERIAKLRALCEAAPPGLGPMLGAISLEMRREHDGGDGHFSTDEVECVERSIPFIAAARTALPEALDEIERLQAEIARLAVLALDLPNALAGRQQA